MVFAKRLLRRNLGGKTIFLQTRAIRHFKASATIKVQLLTLFLFWVLLLFMIYGYYRRPRTTAWENFWDFVTSNLAAERQLRKNCFFNIFLIMISCLGFNLRLFRLVSLLNCVDFFLFEVWFNVSKLFLSRYVNNIKLIVKC